MAEIQNEKLFYRMADIVRITGCSKAGIYLQINKSGTFPKPIKWGARAVRWPADEAHAVWDARRAGKSADEQRALVRQLHAARTAEAESAAAQGEAAMAA